MDPNNSPRVHRQDLGKLDADWLATLMNSPVSAPSTARPLTAHQRSVFRSRLEHELTEVHDLESRLRTEILASLESRRSTTTDEAEDPEGSSLAFEGAQTSSMLQQTTRHADEISAAIGRVENGSYGTCVTCSGRIAMGRLEARPSTNFCIGCAA
jgi:DnaK suppressor protein